MQEQKNQSEIQTREKQKGGAKQNDDPSKEHPKNEQKQNQKSNTSQDLEKINWFQVGPNKNTFTAWHRPALNHIGQLKKLQNLSHVVTVQSVEKEHVQEIENECNQHEVQWISIDLDGANVPLLQNQSKMVASKVEEIYNILNNEKNVNLLVHCAAGIHRTGVTVYSILRRFGFTEKQSLVHLLQIRQETSEGVGQHRIQIAETMIVPNFQVSVSQQPSSEKQNIEQKKSDEPVKINKQDSIVGQKQSNIGEELETQLIINTDKTSLASEKEITKVQETDTL